MSAVDADAIALATGRFGLTMTEHGPVVPRERLVEFARALKDELGFHYLAYVTAAHYPETRVSAAPAPPAASAPTEAAPTIALEAPPAQTIPARFVIVYRVRNLAKNTELPFRCETPVDVPVPSLARVWAGADWQEREAFDLVGPRFENHPDLRRIMLPEDWEGHPLQKQYAIDTAHRPWR